MLALLTNDDGVSARGLLALKKELSKIGQVWVVAPDREQSAISHSLTLQHPLRINRVADRFYSVDGTPTDAVMLAVHAILKRKPDILISGINHGPNMGDDVSYSGTVAAAMEGTILNIPSIAVSNVNWNAKHFGAAAKFVRKLARFVLKSGLPRYTFLNVNVPDRSAAITRFKITRLGKRVYSDVVIEKIDPRGKNYYWIGEQTPIWEKKADDTDFAAIQKGFVSITPLHLDMTDYGAMERIKRWKIL
ncbi:MAG: 5'/3'-nucleotidase SurE [candidate division Zixibacteria bacterium]|nr:5'/3'-nucleotidase SurE [candidate division Zixibacteria bacterium]